MSEAPSQPKEQSPIISAGEVSPEDKLELIRIEKEQRVSAFAGALACMDTEDLRIKKPTKSADEKQLHPEKWSDAALKGKAYNDSDLLPPKSLLERKRVEGLYRARMKRGVLASKLGQEFTNIYNIGSTGKSELRDGNDSLKHLPFRMRRAVRRSEKEHQRHVRKLERVENVFDKRLKKVAEPEIKAVK